MEEDPLTSAAFSLRTSGPVDGRSYQASRRSRDISREQYEAAVSQETQTFTLAGWPGSHGRSTREALLRSASSIPSPAGAHRAMAVAGLAGVTGATVTGVRLLRIPGRRIPP